MYLRRRVKRRVMVIALALAVAALVTTAAQAGFFVQTPSFSGIFCLFSSKC